MVNKEDLIAVLPQRHSVVLTEDRQNTSDIRDLLLRKHKEYAADYDKISHYFDTGNIVDTSRQIFEFLKYNVPYKKESGKYQTIKSPAMILLSNEGTNGLDRVDCKNYASFIGGVIDSIKRNSMGDTWDWCYRFASYNALDPEPGHVFVVVTINDKELWIDPVFTYFNAEEDQPEWELDEKPSIGGLYSISGRETRIGAVKQTVEVNRAVAWQNFLFMITNNMFQLRDLLTKHADITTSQLKRYCQDNGFDYQQLLSFIYYGNQQG
jgi:hypothetical protein